jgi:hypothetical protein
MDKVGIPFAAGDTPVIVKTRALNRLAKERISLYIHTLRFCVVIWGIISLIMLGANRSTRPTGKPDVFPTYTKLNTVRHSFRTLYVLQWSKLHNQVYTCWTTVKGCYNAHTRFTHHLSWCTNYGVFLTQCLCKIITRNKVFSFFRHEMQAPEALVAPTELCFHFLSCVWNATGPNY